MNIGKILQLSLLIFLIGMTNACQAPGTSRFTSDERGLHNAALNGDVARVRQILDSGVDVNARVEPGWSPLHSACRNGHTGVAKLLLDKGADINYRGQRGRNAIRSRTPLHQAVYRAVLGTDSKRFLPVLELLIARGANIDIPDDDGMTPLDQAKKWSNEEIIRLLKRHGAKD